MSFEHFFEPPNLNAEVLETDATGAALKRWQWNGKSWILTRDFSADSDAYSNDSVHRQVAAQLARMGEEPREYTGSDLMEERLEGYTDGRRDERLCGGANALAAAVIGGFGALLGVSAVAKWAPWLLAAFAEACR